MKNLTNDAVLCLYHNDADGRCSAAIVRRAIGARVVMQAMDYQVPIPWEAIEQAGLVVIVDFSLPLEDMKRVLTFAQLIWIDHHKTALENLKEIDQVPGLRSLDEAGCVLAWRHFFPDEPLPEAVAYVGDRDVWRFEFSETTHFSEGLFHEDTDPTNDSLWGPLLDRDHDRVADLIEQGRVLSAARLRDIKRRVARFGFEVEFEGHRALAINERGNGDLGARIRELGYEIAYCYFETCRNDRVTTKVTIYSDQVDVSEIAERFGGGGHPGAAGFTFNRNGSPFPQGANARLILPPSDT